jgi:hypothetical protein
VRGVILTYEKKTASCFCEVSTEDNSFYELNLFCEALKILEIDYEEIAKEVEIRRINFKKRYGEMFKRMSADL